MKRDMDLIRKILLAVEQLDRGAFRTPAIDGFEEEIIAYHCKLLVDDKYIDGSATLTYDGRILVVLQGTMPMRGHDLLDSIRHEGTWTQTRAAVRSSVGTASLSVLQQIANAVAVGLVKGALAMP